MPDLVVYRSDHPDVLAALESYRAAVSAWQTLADEALVDLGFTDRDFAVLHGLGPRRIAGVEYRDGDEPPAGWRIAERGDVTVVIPDMRTRAGKAARARLDELTPPQDVRFTLPGMPGDHLGEATLHMPSLREMAGSWWVTWRCEVPELPAERDEPASRTAAVDLAIWKRAKLSDYYAALETEEAAASADAPEEEGGAE